MLWIPGKKLRVLNNCKNIFAVHWILAAGNIAELWRRHYGTLFNCVSGDLNKVEDMETNVSMTIMSQEVYQAINKVTAEHL